MNFLLRIMLKTLLIIIFVQNYLFAMENVKIILKINDEIITNIDIQKEYNYLIALNNDFKEVNKEKALLIAKESIHPPVSVSLHALKISALKIVT